MTHRSENQTLPTRGIGHPPDKQGAFNRHIRYALNSSLNFSKKVIMSQHVEFFAGVTTGIFCLMLTYHLMALAIGYFMLFWT